jgi:hypothetical protein
LLVLPLVIVFDPILYDRLLPLLPLLLICDLKLVRERQHRPTAYRSTCAAQRGVGLVQKAAARDEVVHQQTIVGADAAALVEEEDTINVVYTVSIDLVHG